MAYFVHPSSYVDDNVSIGDNTKIAAGAVVLQDIPPNSTAVGVPARVVRIDGEKPDDLDQVNIPDPVAQEISRLEQEIEELKKIVGKETEK